MRGYGAPLAPSEGVTSALTYPDWGWGDEAPASWTLATADYGWGSDRGLAFAPYLTTLRVADDGGYMLSVTGTWDRLGASPRQRPTGYAVELVSGSTVLPCYSGRAGQGLVCSTDYAGRVLTCYTPPCAVGAYTVRVRWGAEEVTVGTLSVERRTRTESEYALRAALPNLFATGARALDLEPVLDGGAPSADEETHSTLSVLLRALGQSLADFFGMGVVTRLAAPLLVTDTEMQVESTLGLTDAGFVRVEGTLLRYSGRTTTTLTGLTRPLGQFDTHPTGAQVTHDPHHLAD